MNSRSIPPSIPAEALARQARLAATLRALEQKGPSLEPSTLQLLRRAISGDAAVDEKALQEAILAEDLAEEAAELLRASRRETADQALGESWAQRLAPFAARTRQRRSALWQMDTRRVLVRWTYVKEAPVLDFDDGDIHAIFQLACRLEGLRLALDLGKRPGPLLNVGCPLPSGVGGMAESMDAVLRQEPVEETSAWVARLNQRLPEGLQIIRWEVLPIFASDVGELALAAHWRWEVPVPRRARIEPQMAAFLKATIWPWRRDADASAATLDLCTVVLDMTWADPTLCFSTRMGPTKAVNPLKVLGAILEIDPAEVKGLVRTDVELKPDARLGQAERFEPKLKNMYEDAVLLGGGSNIVLIDEDDDEPIRLGPQP